MEREIQSGIYQEQNITEKQAQILAKLRTPNSGKKIVQYGRRLGLEIEYGGREGTYLKNPLTEARLPVSVHGSKDVCPKATSAAYKFAEAFIVAQSGAIGS